MRNSSREDSLLNVAYFQTAGMGIVVFLGLLSCLALCACQQPHYHGDPSTIVYPIYDDVKDWDPAVAFSLEVMALGNIYEPLHWYEPDTAGGYRFRPALAKSFEKSADGLKWTFHLRTGVVFHDGRLLTSLAVRKTIERTKRLGRGAAFIWNAVRTIDTPDDSTVVFVLSRPAPMDLIAASQYGAWIMSPAITDCTSAYFRPGRASGTGPYKLTGWVKDEEIELTKFPAYWGGWRERSFEQVRLKVVSEATTRIQLVRTGEADFGGLIPPENIAAMKHNADLDVLILPSWRNAMFLLNTAKPPLDNILIRRAIQHAFDYTAAVEHIYHGYAERAKAPVPKNMWGCADNLTQPEFNLEKARQLVKQSQVSQKQLHLTLAYIASVEEYKNCALMLQNNLAQIGVDLELKPGLWNVIWDEAKNLGTAPHIQSMTWWPTYPTPGDYMSGLFRTQSPNLFNLSHYSRTEFDALIDSAFELEGTNRGQAIETYKAAQKILYDDAVAIFVGDLNLRVVKRKSVENFVPNMAYDQMVYFHNLRRAKPVQSADH